MLIEDYASNVECVYTWINDTKIKFINWTKDGEPVDLVKLDAELTLRGRFLYFKKLSHRKHNGVYKCDIELTTGQIIRSINTVNLLVSCTYDLFLSSNFT